MPNETQSGAIYDLRSALRVLEANPGQLLRTRTPVDPNAELAGVYRYVGAGATVARPTKIGPAMLFESIKDYPDARVLAGLLASRRRTAPLMGVPPERLAFRLLDALRSRVAPAEWQGGTPSRANSPARGTTAA